MATQTSDNFTSGGRGASNAAGSLSAGQTVTAWSPASGGPNWIVQVAPSAYSFTGTKGQTTGSIAWQLSAWTLLTACATGVLFISGGAP